MSMSNKNGAEKMEANNIKVYVGRWDYLPAYVEGHSGLMEMSEKDVKAEVSRQWDEYKDNAFINVYSLEEFEETFNECLTQFIDSKKYWIKIF